MKSSEDQNSKSNLELNVKLKNQNDAFIKTEAKKLNDLDVNSEYKKTVEKNAKLLQNDNQNIEIMEAQFYNPEKKILDGSNQKKQDDLAKDSEIKDEENQKSNKKPQSENAEAHEIKNKDETNKENVSIKQADFESELPAEILQKYNKFGPWKAYEHISSESAFFSFLPDALFKWRNIISRPFTLHPFPCFQLCWGEILLLILMTAVSIGLGVILYISDVENRNEALGSFSSLLFAVSFVSSGKNLIFHLVIGMPFERQILFHKYVAFLAVGLAIAHGITKGLHRDESMSGLILTCLCGFMIVNSFFYLRRYCYRLFYIIHVITIPAILVFSLIHEAGAIIIGIGIWLIDVLIRIFLMIKFHLYIEKTEVFLMPGGFIRVEITPKPKKRFKFKSGQYIFINIPASSFWEWHPFSICNTSFDGKIILHFKSLGRWTKGVKKLLEKKGKEVILEIKKPGSISKDVESNSLKEGILVKRLQTKVMINGPYGAPRVDIDSPNYKVVLLVTGGIGITPMHSIFNELVIQYIRGRPFTKIKLIWSLREKDLVDSVAGHKDSLLSRHIDPIQTLKQNTFPNIVTFKLKEVVETEIYITKGGNQEIVNELQSKYRIEAKLGRPKLPKIFQSLGEIAANSGNDRVAVLTCGPSGLISDCYRQSYKHSKHYNVLKSNEKAKKKKVSFHFHSEVFEF